MGNEVYANGREVSCKAAAGKSICAMPDVCMTPPQTPATPPGIPIPYPNTGMASDCTDGSKSVKISGKEVLLKNKSYFKKSSGNEAGCAPMKGVVSHKNMGKVFFNAWSMDVKFEGENVVRHLDLTTHNHASFPGNSPTWPFLDAAAFSGVGACKDVAKEVNDNCSKRVVKTKKGDVKRAPSMKAMCKDPECKKALKCVLTKKSPNNCCPNSKGKKPTPHHVVPDSQFNNESGGRLKLGAGKKYSYNGAPCVCAEGNSHSTGKHGDIHTETNNLTVNHPSVVSNVSATGKSIKDGARWKVSEAEAVGAKAAAEVTKCPEACIQAQVRAGHDGMGIKPDDQIRPTTAGSVTKPPLTKAPAFKKK